MTIRGPLFKSGDYLYAGDSLVSANGKFCAYLFEDGNLCIYNSPTPDANTFMWASGPQVGLGPKCAFLHKDGNLCLYNSPTPDATTNFWCSGSQATPGPKCAYLHDDGNLCIYNSPTPDASTYIWGSSASRPVVSKRGPLLKSGESLQAGDYLVSANGLFCAYLFEDGNLCIYNSPAPDANTFMWASGPQVALGPKCVYLFEDGNLCIYNSPTPDASTFVWASGPQVGPGPKCAYLHDDGNLCIYNSPTPDASTYIWGSRATHPAVGPGYQVDISDPLQHSHILTRMRDESDENIPTLADLLNAAQAGGSLVDEVFHQLHEKVQQIQQSATPWYQSSWMGLSGVGDLGGAVSVAKGAKKIFNQRAKAKVTRAASDQAREAAEEARARANQARSEATDARARQMANEELGPGEEEVSQLEDGAAQTEATATEFETTAAEAEAAAAEADAAASTLEAAADAAVMAEVSAFSATGVGLVVVGITAIVASLALALTEHDEKQVHIVVNDSPYELSFNAQRNLLNYHGKSIILPQGSETRPFILPPRTEDGDVSMAIIGFQKNEGALYGCEGAYEFIANPNVANGAAALPNGLKCFYYQPYSGKNSIGINMWSEANLNDFWAAYESEDARLVDATYSNATGMGIFAGLNSHDGGSGKAVIYIRG